MPGDVPRRWRLLGEVVPGRPRSAHQSEAGQDDRRVDRRRLRRVRDGDGADHPANAKSIFAGVHREGARLVTHRALALLTMLLCSLPSSRAIAAPSIESWNVTTTDFKT